MRYPGQTKVIEVEVPSKPVKKRPPRKANTIVARIPDIILKSPIGKARQNYAVILEKPKSYFTQIFSYSNDFPAA
jgi:hypothetical protein